MYKVTFFLIVLITHCQAQCWRNFSVGNLHCIATKTDGTLWAWGNNDGGQLCNGSNLNENSPLQIGTDNNWKEVLAGNSHSQIIKIDRTRWGCGFNANGQLGNTTLNNEQNLIQLDTLTNWRNIFGSATSICFSVKADSSLWTWGYNGNGLAGVSNYNDNLIPIQVGIEKNWTKACSGSNHSLALKSNGTLWAAGVNGFGSLGNNLSPTPSTVFVQVNQDTDWNYIAAGWAHSAAIKNDGSLWTWGYNNSGQLGTGNLNNSSIPIKVGNSIWKSVSCGQYHTLAIKLDGTLWAWGLNDNGQLGDGTFNNSSTPIQIGLDNNWESVGSNPSFYVPESFSIGLKSDGSLWAWGGNTFGQLGNGTNININIPIEVTNLGCTSLSIETEESSHDLSIFPSPAGEWLNIKKENEKSIQSIFITDYTGRNLLKSSFTNSINISFLSSGIYFLNYSIEDRSFALKFIKE